jgi:hypothetical protein
LRSRSPTSCPRVVDLLEVVQIEEDDGDDGLVPARLRHGEKKMVVEECSVGKPGEGIVGARMTEVLLHLDLFGDVPVGSHDAQRFSLRVS